MSSCAIIQNIDLGQRVRIFDALERASGVNLGFRDTATNSVLEAQGADAPRTARIAFRLHQVGVDKSLRRRRMLPQPGQADEPRLPPPPLPLRYRFTPLDDDEATHELIAGRLLQHLSLVSLPSDSPDHNCDLLRDPSAAGALRHPTGVSLT